jgi:hypothetical protein
MPCCQVAGVSHRLHSLCPSDFRERFQAEGRRRPKEWPGFGPTRPVSGASVTAKSLNGRTGRAAESSFPHRP